MLPFGVKSALLQPADPCRSGTYFKPVRPLTTFSPPQRGHSDVTGVGLQLKNCSLVWSLISTNWEMSAEITRETKQSSQWRGEEGKPGLTGTREKVLPAWGLKKCSFSAD